MTTVLFYLVIAAVIGLVVFFLAVFVFGRGEQMAPLDPRTSPAELPEDDISSDDVRKIRFALALRGYRMSDVDWTLERLGDQLDELRREIARLRGEQPDVEAGAPGEFAPDGEAWLPAESSGTPVSTPEGTPGSTPDHARLVGAQAPVGVAQTGSDRAQGDPR